MLPIEFAAPWARSLRTSTVGLLLAAVVVVIIAWLARNSLGVIWTSVAIAVPVALLSIALLSSLRGYRITEHEIQIDHLGWAIVLPLSTLLSVEGDSDVLRGSFCLFANPGVFSLTGWYWNRRLKLYRAHATDPSRAVILRFERRVIVVTPHDPQHFIIRARTLAKTALHPLGRNA